MEVQQLSAFFKSQIEHVVLVYLLAVLDCSVVVLAWPFVCPLVELVVLSVGLFITDSQ